MISGLIKDHDLFSSLYNFIIKKVKSKRWVVFLISCFGGVMPIPGRIVVSAGMLDTLIDKKSKSRSKYGIIDFLSTHHYYWWSPLEKTVAIPMAVLGLSYLQFMKYTWVPLLISICFVLYYVFIDLKENEVSINKPELNNSKGIIVPVLPLAVSVLLLCFGIEPYIIFPFTVIFYMIITKEFEALKLLSYVNWKLITIITGVLLLSTYLKQHNSQILELLDYTSDNLNINTLIGFHVISLLAFMSAFILGSSSKYAGIVSMLVSIFGLHYLTYFLTLTFAAYILSPTHKCVLISSQYFNTPLKSYYKVLVLWGSMLITYGLLTLITL